MSTSITSRGGRSISLRKSSSDFYVSAFGAAGDGITNDAFAFQAAIDAAKVAGGKVVIPGGRTYLIEAALDLTWQLVGTRYGLIIEGEGSALNYANIIFKHTGHGFDCTGRPDIIFENINVSGDITTSPQTAWLFARRSDGSSAGRHRLRNCRSDGKFTKAVVYSYGSEENFYTDCHLTNDYTAGAASVLVSSAYNIKNVTSSFIIIATGAQSNIVLGINGGSYHMNSGHASADLFYLETSGNFRVSGGPWLYCGSATVDGRSLVYVDGTNGSSNNCSFIGVTGEVGSFMQAYGVLFSNHVRTHTGWTIGAFRCPTRTRLLAGAGASVTLNDFTIWGLSEVTANGINVPGTLQNSCLQLPETTVIIGTSINNFFVVNPAYLTITNPRDRDIHAYIGTGCFAPATGIKFQATQPAPSADANTLDDYKEDDATQLGITFDTPGDLAVTYGSRTMQITKIGRRVFLDFQIETSAFTHTTAAGNFKITGLSTTPVSKLVGAVLTRFQGITKAGYTQFAARTTGGADTYLQIQASASASAPALVTAADMPTGGTVGIYVTLSYHV